MKIYLATDHAGFEHKNTLKLWLEAEGQYEVIDCGANIFDVTDDYPDFISKAANNVNNDPVEAKAIIFGGSGQGEAMLANKYENIRATVYYGQSLDIIKLSREHNDANILAIGARFVGIDEMIEAVALWLSTDFSKDARHVRRIKKSINLKM